MGQLHICLGVVHLGRSPTCGHYRAALRVGGAWYYTNDSVQAVRTPIQAEHKQGVYVLFLLRSDQFSGSS